MSTELTESAQIMIGKTISHYEIVGKLGEGGMGVVYKARDIKLGRQVALKFLATQLNDTGDGKARFIQEAKTASALDHPNICAIHEISETESGQSFIVMAYYEGQTLHEKVKNDELEFEDALKLATQIADGLNRAHQNAIVHRDIKPSNIIVTQHNEAKILDFGLAKLVGDSRLTRTGETLGTAAFMSPEQIQGLDVDHRSDIFAWGVVFYEMLTKQLPFKGEYQHALMYAILHEDPVPIRSLDENLPEEIELILNKALAKKPDDRYQLTSELLEDLQALQGHTQAKVQSGTNLHASKNAAKSLPVRQNPLAANKTKILLATGLVLVIALLVGLGRSAFDSFLNFTSPSAAKHIAILGFTNIGDDPLNQALCDGLVETLTSKLSQLEQFQGSLWVVPTSEIRKSNVTTASEAKKLFGVNMVITGSVQNFPNQLRLTMNLIDANNLRQLASKQLDDPLTSSSVLQDEAVVKLAEMLNVELLPETRQVLQAGATKVPGAYELYLQARGFLQDYDKLENIDASIGLFKNALKQDPEYASAFAGLGEAYLRKFQLTKELKWVDQAEENCERAVQLDPLLAPAHITQGMLYNETGKYQDGLGAFQKALELDAASADAYGGRAMAFLSQGQVDEAEATYKKAISMKPDYWGSYNDLGVFYFRQGRYADAIPQFEKVIELTPQNAKGYRNLASMYLQLGHEDEAVAYYEKALKISPSYSIYSNLATLYYNAAKYDEAASMYEKALEFHDADYRVWGTLGAAYKQNPKRKEKAKQAYQEAIDRAEKYMEVNPNDPYLLLRLAGYYIEFDEQSKSLDLVQKAITLNPNDAEVFFRIGSIYEQLGKRDQALQWLSQSLLKGYPESKIISHPILSDLSKDRRYKEIVQKVQEAN